MNGYAVHVSIDTRNIHTLYSMHKNDMNLIEKFDGGNNKVVFGLKVNMKQKTVSLFRNNNKIGVLWQNIPNKIMPAVYLWCNPRPSNICTIQHVNL